MGIKINTIKPTQAAIDGTVSAPGIAFALDTNTGVYRIGADNIGIATNGTLRISIDSTGKVGINEASPTQMFEITKGHWRYNQVSSPGAPTVAVNVAAGNLNGNYYYRISYVTALGESETGTVSALVAPANQQVNLTNIPTSSDGSVTSRKIYRTTAGGDQIKCQLVTTIADNTTTTYTDNIADGALGVQESRVNTTGGVGYNGSIRVFAVDPAITLLGYNAGLNNTGHLNTFIGQQAGRDNTNGWHNTFVGFQAGIANTTGYHNTALGETAGEDNLTGYDNVFIGRDANHNNTIGSENVFVGGLAGSWITDGVTPHLNGTRSVYIGASTKAAADGQTNQIVIGYNTTGNGPNTITLGNTSVTASYIRGNIIISAQKWLTVGVFTDAQRPAASVAGRVIYNSTDSNLNIDNGTNWILPNGTVT